MRVKSDLWVKAYVRRCAAAGAPAMVVRHGDDEAGAIYIKIARLDSTAALYGPAPSGFDAAERGSMFSVHLEAGTDEAKVEEHIARQREFDPDLWLVEVEDRQGRHFLEAWLMRDG